MMEVQQRLSCLSPTQRLTTHSPASSLRTLPTSPLTLPLPAPASQASTMIIEASLHAATTPPDSPQQAETVPNGVSEDHETNFSLPDEAQNEKSSNLAHKYQKEQTDSHALWSQGSEMPNGMDEFSQGGMAREGVEEEGSAESPQQSSPREGEDLSASTGRELGPQETYSLPEEPESCYTPPSHFSGPRTPGTQENGDRRNRRKQTIEDIVRRIATSETEEDDVYQSEEIDEDAEPMTDMEMSRSHMTDDEVDGAPLEISREILNAQACAESAIKKSFQARFEEREELGHEGEEELDRYTPLNFLHADRKEPEDSREDGKENQESPWHSSKLPLFDNERGDKKPGVTILPKTGMPPHLPPSMGGLHSSLPMSSNISETAYSPHHFSTAKMNNGWFPGAMPHLFPFSPAGLMDHPMGPKFLPFENKMVAEVDKDYLKCNYCERTFRRQKNLENHIESTHQGKGGQRPKREAADMYFKCTHCPYTTKHQSNLYVHLRIHTGERPYICGACGVQYSQSHSLKSHIINKHDGHMNYYIKEKRNRSPRGMGYMATHPGDHGTIFKMPPPPSLPSLAGLQHNSMEHMAVARAIEMASKNSFNEGQGPPPPLMHPQNIPSSVHQHSSPLMSPNGPHGLFSKPGFPFGGHFGSPGMPFGDLPSTPTPAMIPQPSPGSRMSSAGSPISPVTSNHNNTSSGGRNDILNLTSNAPCHTPNSALSFSASTPTPIPSLLSPGKQRSSPVQHNSAPNNNNKVARLDCGAMDLSTRGCSGPDGKGRSAGGEGRCGDCPQETKLKLLRLNVVRMLSILVPNLNFEEKGISAESDSVDELLQDVIESNTHDDDMVH